MDWGIPCSSLEFFFLFKKKEDIFASFWFAEKESVKLIVVFYFHFCCVIHVLGAI